jgi:hypothetical protein
LFYLFVLTVGQGIASSRKANVVPPRSPPPDDDFFLHVCARAGLPEYIIAELKKAFGTRDALTDAVNTGGPREGVLEGVSTTQIIALRRAVIFMNREHTDWADA